MLYNHKAVEDKEFEAVVQTDLMWSVLSFSGVFAYSVFHTRSFLVAATGMFCSTLSYPTALLIYRAIFRVRPHMQWMPVHMAVSTTVRCLAEFWP